MQTILYIPKTQLKSDTEKGLEAVLLSGHVSWEKHWENVHPGPLPTLATTARGLKHGSLVLSLQVKWGSYPNHYHFFLPMLKVGSNPQACHSRSCTAILVRALGSSHHDRLPHTVRRTQPSRTPNLNAFHGSALRGTVSSVPKVPFMSFALWSTLSTTLHTPLSSQALSSQLTRDWPHKQQECQPQFPNQKLGPVIWQKPKLIRANR